MVLMSGSKKARNAAALTNQTTIFGIMPGLAPTANVSNATKRAYEGKAVTALTIPADPISGFHFMLENGLLSVNPTGSGGVGAGALLIARVLGPCVCGPGPTLRLTPGPAPVPPIVPDLPDWFINMERVPLFTIEEDQYGIVEFALGKVLPLTDNPKEKCDGTYVLDDTASRDESGFCAKDVNGEFPSMVDCENSKLQKYRCTGIGACVPSSLGEYNNFTACTDKCKDENALQYDCLEGKCFEVADGKYKTSSECEEYCVYGGFDCNAGGQCVEATYPFQYKSREACNDACQEDDKNAGYTCNREGACYEEEGGVYPELKYCEESCTNQGPTYGYRADCADGSLVCKPVPGGEYDTYEACQSRESCGEWDCIENGVTEELQCLEVDYGKGQYNSSDACLKQCDPKVEPPTDTIRCVQHSESVWAPGTHDQWCDDWCVDKYRQGIVTRKAMKEVLEAEANEYGKTCELAPEYQTSFPDGPAENTSSSTNVKKLVMWNPVSVDADLLPVSVLEQLHMSVWLHEGGDQKCRPIYELDPSVGESRGLIGARISFDSNALGYRWEVDLPTESFTRTTVYIVPQTVKADTGKSETPSTFVNRPGNWRFPPAPLLNPTDPDSKPVTTICRLTLQAKDGSVIGYISCGERDAGVGGSIVVQSSGTGLNEQKVFGGLIIGSRTTYESDAPRESDLSNGERLRCVIPPAAGQSTLYQRQQTLVASSARGSIDSYYPGEVAAWHGALYTNISIENVNPENGQIRNATKNSSHINVSSSSTINALRKAGVNIVILSFGIFVDGKFFLYYSHSSGPPVNDFSRNLFAYSFVAIQVKVKAMRKEYEDDYLFNNDDVRADVLLKLSKVFDEPVDMFSLVSAGWATSDQSRTITGSKSDDDPEPDPAPGWTPEYTITFSYNEYSLEKGKKKVKEWETVRGGVNLSDIFLESEITLITTQEKPLPKVAYGADDKQAFYNVREVPDDPNKRLGLYIFSVEAGIPEDPESEESIEYGNLTIFQLNPGYEVASLHQFNRVFRQTANNLTVAERVVSKDTTYPEKKGKVFISLGGAEDNSKKIRESFGIDPGVDNDGASPPQDAEKCMDSLARFMKGVNNPSNDTVPPQDPAIAGIDVDVEGWYGYRRVETKTGDWYFPEEYSACYQVINVMTQFFTNWKNHPAQYVGLHTLILSCSAEMNAASAWQYYDDPNAQQFGRFSGGVLSSYDPTTGITVRGSYHALFVGGVLNYVWPQYYNNRAGSVGSPWLPGNSTCSNPENTGWCFLVNDSLGKSIYNMWENSKMNGSSKSGEEPLLVLDSRQGHGTPTAVGAALPANKCGVPEPQEAYSYLTRDIFQAIWRGPGQQDPNWLQALEGGTPNYPRHQPCYAFWDMSRLFADRLFDCRTYDEQTAAVNFLAQLSQVYENGIPKSYAELAKPAVAGYIAGGLECQDGSINCEPCLMEMYDHDPKSAESLNYGLCSHSGPGKISIDIPVKYHNGYKLQTGTQFESCVGACGKGGSPPTQRQMAHMQAYCEAHNDDNSISRDEQGNAYTSQCTALAHLGFDLGSISGQISDGFSKPQDVARYCSVGKGGLCPDHVSVEEDKESEATAHRHDEHSSGTVNADSDSDFATQMAQRVEELLSDPSYGYSTHNHVH